MNKDYFRYVEYEDIYPNLFERAKIKLLKELKPIENIKIEHIGSSSVPGLGGKGLIDINIAVPKNKMKHARDLLLKAGYLWDKKYDFGMRYFFRKNYIGFGKKRELHASITFEKSQLWIDAIATRDYLKNHPKDLEIYAKIKREGAKIANGEGEKYRNHKSGFLKKITKKALKIYLSK